ncbi:MAG: hypothetical protein JO288_12275 [Hyphomicrobiales bacterium]|nr:hypothetical protein [Hyphomicrobiales bacterium]
MRLTLVGSGLCAAGLLALGFGGVAPIGGPLDTLCDVGGIASTVMFVGLLEGT